MPWTCKKCGVTTRATNLVYPIRCSCGVADYGDYLKTNCQFISHQQRHQDVLAFLSHIPPEVTAVAGVPRSGMFAASIIAEQLHLALFSFTDQGWMRLKSGWRHTAAEDDGYLLIVDDTVATGASRNNLSHPGRDYLFATIYCPPEQRTKVDLFQRLLPLPHYLEWNIFNSVYTPFLATDIDGILCSDPPARLLEKQQECGYEKWLIKAPLLQRPLREVIPLIATGRSRRYRQHTESWLEVSGIRYDQLVFPQTEEEYLNPGKMKAEAYGASSATIFIESDQKQARLIAKLTGKRVICPASQEVLN